LAIVHNFYLPPQAWRAPFRLEGPEARHLAHVLRLKVGAVVRLFDGFGRHGLFRIDSLSRTVVALAQQTESVEIRPSVRCTLAAGFSKALRRGWFMEKAVELETSALWFWQGEHSQASLPEAEKETWKASLVAGAKQCCGAWLPELHMLHGGVAALAAKRPFFDRAFLLYEGETGGRMLRREDLIAPGEILLVVGPEGGFSRRELVVLQEAGITPVSLGARTLRWETAAVLTLGLAWWARQKAAGEESHCDAPGSCDAVSPERGQAGAYR
jgi:16S rRNA (uracil1498-N3)-methyltransferase